MFSKEAPDLLYGIGRCLARGEIFGDEVVAAAMIDRLVHHAEILSLKGDSYRLRDLGGRPPAVTPESA